MKPRTFLLSLLGLVCGFLAAAEKPTVFSKQESPSRSHPPG